VDVSFFPCCVCGCSTFGIDRYVVCANCEKEYDQRPFWEIQDYDEVAYASITPEVEARLRKLLDW
jgi:hypothetical protein